MTKVQVLVAVVVLTIATITAVLLLAITRTVSDAQSFITTIIAFIGPTIGILIAMLRLEGAANGVASKVDEVHTLVNSQHTALVKRLDRANARVEALLAARTVTPMAGSKTTPKRKRVRKT